MRTYSSEWQKTYFWVMAVLDIKKYIYILLDYWRHFVIIYRGKPDYHAFKATEKNRQRLPRTVSVKFLPVFNCCNELLINRSFEVKVMTTYKDNVKAKISRIFSTRRFIKGAWLLESVEFKSIPFINETRLLPLSLRPVVGRHLEVLHNCMMTVALHK